MTSVTPFCVVGGHAYHSPTGSLSEGAGLPEDWYITRASFDRVKKVWYLNPDSPAGIIHCGEHPIDPKELI